MRCFVSLSEVALARLPTELCSVITQSVQNMLDVHGECYDPANDGYVVLMDQSATDEDAKHLFGCSWANVPLEAVKYDKKARVFLAVVLLNNQLAHCLIVPDMPWVIPEFRANLLENIIGEGPP